MYVDRRSPGRARTTIWALLGEVRSPVLRGRFHHNFVALTLDEPVSQRAQLGRTRPDLRWRHFRVPTKGIAGAPGILHTARVQSRHVPEKFKVAFAFAG